MLKNELTSEEEDKVPNLPPLKRCGRPRTQTDEKSVKHQEHMRRYFYRTYENPPTLWLITQATWYIVRTVCMLSLFIIFYRGTLRIKKKKGEQTT